jgi:hypothetical protein
LEPPSDAAVAMPIILPSQVDVFPSDPSQAREKRIRNGDPCCFQPLIVRVLGLKGARFFHPR